MYRPIADHPAALLALCCSGFAVLEQGRVFANPGEILKVKTGLTEMWKNQPGPC